MRGIKAVLPVVAVVVAASAGTASAAGETYDQYSLIYQKSAGQLVDSAGTPASQWAWRPGGAGQSVIRWDLPSNWNNPADGLEHFARGGDWLYLDGYENQSTGTYNRQRVTAEWIGDAGCANLRVLPSHGGQQHYVRWNIPGQAYCLIAEGTIGTPAGSVTFRHQQVWSPPTTCQTKYFGAVRCVEQHEKWWDDNGHPYGVPIDWRADLRNVWTWT